MTTESWGPSTWKVAASGMAPASLRWFRAGTVRSRVVTMTAAGTSTSPIQSSERIRPTERIDVSSPAGSARTSSERIHSARGSFETRRSTRVRSSDSAGPEKVLASRASGVYDRYQRSETGPPWKLRAVEHSTRPDTRSRWRRHRSWATAPPME